RRLVAVRLRTLEDLGELAGSRVFVRADFNVPLEQGRIVDDSRIRATLPTLRELLDAGAGLVVTSHLGRPKGKAKDELRMGPVAKSLADLLGRRVSYTSADVVVTHDAAVRASAPAAGEVLLLENLRF